MLRASEIPSDKFIEVCELIEMGMSYSELREASKHGGILDRKVVPQEKGRAKIFYRSKNFAIDLSRK